MTDGSADEIYSDIDDRRAFVSAAAALSRSDEALIRIASARALFEPNALRSEAAAIASMEGASARPDAIARLLADPEATMLERSAHTAADIMKALAAARDWASTGPAADEVSQIFMTSDASTARRIKADMAWSLEEDSEFVSHELSRVVETPEPWTAIEVVRRIWTSGRFFGHSRRMAMICAPWIVQQGFSLTTPFFGVADQVRKNLDSYREHEPRQDEWAVLFASSLARAGGVTRKKILDLQALKTTLTTLCPAERSSSSVDSAIQYFMANPIASAKRFGDALNLTPRGSKVVLDKLVDAGVLESEGGSRNRSFICRRAL